MKRILFFALSGVLLFAVSCTDYEYPDLSYKGAVLVEIKNQQFQRPLTSQVVSNSEFAKEVNDALVRDSFLVQLIGPHQTSAITVNFNIVETPDAAATPPIIGAVPGTHYNMITTGNQVTIPAGQSSAWIRVAPVLVPGSVMPIQRRRFRLTLTGASGGVGISPNAANFDYTIRD